MLGLLWVGTIGGIVGSFIGSKAGSYFIEETIIKESVGVSNEMVVQKVNENLNELIPKLVSNAFDNTASQIKPMENFISSLLIETKEFKNKISSLQAGVKNA